MVPADPAVDVMHAFQQASQSVAQELVIESALHIPVTQRFECFQRYTAAFEVDLRSNAAPALVAVLASVDAAESGSSTNSSVSTTAMPAGIAEAAACYAAPPEAPAERELPQISRAAQRVCKAAGHQLAGE